MIPWFYEKDFWATIISRTLNGEKATEKDNDFASTRYNEEICDSVSTALEDMDTTGKRF